MKTTSALKILWSRLYRGRPDRIKRLKESLRDMELSDETVKRLESQFDANEWNNPDPNDIHDPLADLETELAASRDIAATYQAELHRCRTAENHAAVELEQVRTVLGIVSDPERSTVTEIERMAEKMRALEECIRRLNLL